MAEEVVVHGGEFSKDERVEIRGFFLNLRHRRWLWGRLRMWATWITAVGGSSLVFVKWANEIIPQALSLLKLIGIGGA